MRQSVGAKSQVWTMLISLTYFYSTTNISFWEIWQTTLKAYLKHKSAAEGWHEKSSLNHACSRFSGHDDNLYFYFTRKLSSQEIWLTTLKVYLKRKSAAEGWRKKSTLNHACSRFSGHDDEVPFRRSSIIWLESRNFEVDLNYFIRSFVI